MYINSNKKLHISFIIIFYINKYKKVGLNLSASIIFCYKILIYYDYLCSCVIILN